jgi:hypothetical protein
VSVRKIPELFSIQRADLFFEVIHSFNDLIDLQHEFTLSRIQREAPGFVRVQPFDFVFHIGFPSRQRVAGLLLGND